MKFKRQGFFKKIGDTIPNIVGNNLKKFNFIQISILQSWADIVGKKIANCSYPIKVVFTNQENLGGKLFLKVERGKTMEIEFKCQEIIEKLNQFFGYQAITKINIVQNLEINNSNKSKNYIPKNKTRNHSSESINKIKQIKLQKALKKLDKTIFGTE